MRCLVVRRSGEIEEFNFPQPPPAIRIPVIPKLVALFEHPCLITPLTSAYEVKTALPFRRSGDTFIYIEE